MALPPLSYQTITNYAPPIVGTGTTVNDVETVFEYIPTRAIAGLSHYGGEPSISLIPTGGTNIQTSSMEFPIPEDLRAQGMLLANVITETTTEITPTYRRQLRVITPSHESAKAGFDSEQTLRVAYSDLTSTYSALFYGNGAPEESGDVIFSRITLVNDPNYDGPPFNGNTPPFLYRGQMVYPKWDGEVGNSTSSFNYYPVELQQPQLTWNASGERFYHMGVDRGVIYRHDGVYAPWNGLISVAENTNMASPIPLYIDGFPFANVQEAAEFSATVNAYHAPKEFGVCDGTAEVINGLFVTQQRRQPFDFTYRTLIGNDAEGESHGYKIHLVYNATATQGETTNATKSNTPQAMQFNWTIDTLPIVFPGKRPTAHLVIDSRYTPAWIIHTLEDILYGSISSDPQMPTVEDLIALFTQ